MDKLPAFDETYLIETLLEILDIPSPTGRIDKMISELEEKLNAKTELNLQRTSHGALVATTRWIMAYLLN
jgi:putative aminopeptidase FrvX